MLTSLSAARNETEATLERQRAFVADASHELRTPLTSVLANLELLVDSLRGTGSRGRRSRRCARRSGCAASLATCCCSRAPTPVAPRRATASILPRSWSTGPASELEPAARDHAIELDVNPAPLARQPRRPPARRHQPDRERAAPHAAGNARHGEHAHAARRRGSSWSSPTTARASRPKLARHAVRPLRPAAPATAAAPSASASRSSPPSPRPTAGPSASTRHPTAAPASRSASAGRARRRTSSRARQRVGPQAGARCSAQTSTTTGSTIGRRLRRS